jgi:cysteine desulfurase
VRRVCEKLEEHGFEITWLDVSEDGFLDLNELKNSLRDDTAIVSVMLANNETGILFPVEEIASIVKENSDAIFHVDGVNAVGKIPIDLKQTEIDLFSISGHKFHAPKGVGALYIKSGVELPSLSIGGGQENGRRAGTEAVHQIVALGAAADFVKDFSAMDKVKALRDRLENEILDKIPNSHLNGTGDARFRLPNTSSISFEKCQRRDDSGKVKRRGRVRLDRFGLQLGDARRFTCFARDEHSIFTSNGRNSFFFGKIQHRNGS